MCANVIKRISLNKKNSSPIVNIHGVGVKQYKRISTIVDLRNTVVPLLVKQYKRISTIVDS